MREYVGVVVITLLFHCSFQLIPLPDFIHPCHELTDECFTKATLDAIPGVVKGIPEADIPTLDPLFIEKNISMVLPGNLKMQFHNAKLIGLSTCVPDKVSSKREKRMFIFDMHCNFTIRGLYSLRGRLLLFNLDTDGYAKIKIWNQHIRLEVVEKVVLNSEGQGHYKINSYKYKADYGTDLKMNLTNLIRGNPEITTMLINWIDIMNESPEVRMALPLPARAPDPSALAAYWAEYEDLCRQISPGPLIDDDDTHYEEGELEADWLQAAGLGSLAAPFQAGLEVTEAQLGEAVRPLPREQAAAVRRRVRRLNRTVRRKRAASRAKKPDIRDVFRDLENSSGSEPRSRSATPDSLDSLPSGGSGSPPAEWAEAATPPDFVDSFPPAGTHAPLARTPSAPAVGRRARLSPPVPAAHSPPLPMHELFKPNDLHWADIATNTEGIELLGYQRYGTVQGPRIGKERINGSILKENERFIKHAAVSRAKSTASAQQPLSFEHKFNLDRQMLDHEEEWPEKESCVDIETVSEPQLKRLQPLLWLELTALFDRYSLPFHKRKPPKKKRKEEGNVFGVSLETLVRKDVILWEETWSVPSVVRALAARLRARTQDEGLLRVPGNKHKIENLCQLIEREWYGQRAAVEEALDHASSHDMAAAFKRLLRDLPQPPLTQELMRLFYHTYALSGTTQGRALNLLVLLLPAEQRATLRELLQLARHIVAHQQRNKMTDHNVAMIIAPALFPPSLLIKASDNLETQLATAANSCHVTEALMRWCDQLWTVPASLLAASQRKPPPHRRLHHT